MIDRLSVQNNSYARTTSNVTKENEIDHSQEEHINKQNDNLKLNLSTKAEKEDEIEKVIKGINNFIQPTHTSIKFVLHEKLDDYYVNIIDDQTQEVIKEIPSKKLMDTYAAMMEFVGLMVDEKA